MVRKKKSDKHAAPVVQTFEELESLGDRMAQWIAAHAALVAILVVLLLISAGSIQAYRSATRASTEEASNALARVHDAYLLAMGASPANLEIPELANPDTQAGVREDFSKRFAEVANSNAGTVQAALAWLESGDLLGETGDRDAATEAWRKGLESVPKNASVRGTLLVRIASDQEDRGNWQEAADTHVEASNLERYPLRYWAMADAARCFDRAGDTARALELLEQVEKDKPRLQLPEYMRARLNELRAIEKSRVQTG